MTERGMRCTGCGRVWFSAVAPLVVARFRCFSCEGAMHLDRRMQPDRRDVALQMTG